MPLLSPNQQCQSREEKLIKKLTNKITTYTSSQRYAVTVGVDIAQGDLVSCFTCTCQYLINDSRTDYNMQTTTNYITACMQIPAVKIQNYMLKIVR